MGKTSEGVGVIRLGEVSSYGKWEASRKQLRISFNTRTLNSDAQRSLFQYQSTTKPRPVQLPEERSARDGVVMGFERNNGEITFYVSRPDGN